MKKRTLTIAASLIPLAGLLLVADAAWAQAKKTPIEGEWFRCWSLEDPERDWRDEDGIRHVRNIKFRCRHRGDIVGRETGWESWDGRGPGEGVAGHGYTSFVGTVLGEPAMAVVRYTFECIRVEGELICNEDAVWHLDDGSLIKISATHDNEYKPYSGILLDPPGRN
jgi:hypothetical protein